MATSLAEPVKVNDVTLCPICFEKFQTPRYLPCKHSFCHDCLCSYIVSQCKSTEPRLGFNCPICRQYTRSDGNMDQPETWAGCFPVNDVLEKMVSQPDAKHCELCLKENKEETATDYCLSCKDYLCSLCTKWHLKFLAMNDHKIIKLCEMESINIFPTQKANRCPMHCNEEVQIYCIDHEQTCCGLCGATEHRNCKNIKMILQAGQDLMESGETDTLLKATNAFKEKLFSRNKEKKSNIAEIQSLEDEKQSEFEEELKFLMQHLEKLKEEYFDEMSSISKEGREKLRREMDRLEDSVMCLNSCIEDLQMAKDTDNESERVTKFLTAKDTFRKIKKVCFKDTHVKIETVFMWRKMYNLQNVAIVSLMERPQLIDFDVRLIELTEYKRITIEKGNIKAGLVLSGGNFLLLNETEGTCMMYDEQWNCCQVIKCLPKPHDVIQNEEGIFVTNPEVKLIEVFFSHQSQFQRLRTIPMSYTVRGISSFEGNLFVSCPEAILKIDNTGTVTKFCYNSTNKYSLTATKGGLVLLIQCPFFSTIEKVVAMTSLGEIAWEYKSFKLKYPCGLDVDSRDQIYVAGRDSNNVHVLSYVGELIRVIENIPKPLFFKVNEARGTVCVGSGSNGMIVYKF